MGRASRSIQGRELSPAHAAPYGYQVPTVCRPFGENTGPPAERSAITFSWVRHQRTVSGGGWRVSPERRVEQRPKK